MGPTDVRFAQPPVKVVELTIFFDQLEGLQASHLSQLREKWRGEYPQVAELAPSAPPRNNVTRPTISGPGSGTWPCPEVQFSTADGDEGLAIQNDRVIRRWYFGFKEYPGFAALSDDLLSRLDQFEHVLKTELGVQGLTFTGGQCWYVNEIENMNDDELAVGLLTGWSGTVANTGVRRWSFLRLHKCDDVELDGCSLTATVDGNHEDSPVLILDSLTDDVREGEGPRELIDRAHGQLLREFMELTSEVQHEKWGKE